MGLIRVFDDTRGKARCRSCAMPISWFESAAGKRIPFDGDPVYIKTELQDADRRLIGVIDTEIHPCHFETCPDAASWRRK